MVDVTETMSQIVLRRKQHLEHVAGVIAERRSDIALFTRYVGHFSLQLRERCSQQQHRAGAIKALCQGLEVAKKTFDFHLLVKF